MYATGTPSASVIFVDDVLWQNEVATYRFSSNYNTVFKQDQSIEKASDGHVIEQYCRII